LKTKLLNCIENTRINKSSLQTRTIISIAHAAICIGITMKKAIFLILTILSITVYAQETIKFNYNYPLEWTYNCYSMVVQNNYYYLSGTIGITTDECDSGIIGYHINKINDQGIRDTIVIYSKCHHKNYLGWQGSMVNYNDTIIVVGLKYIEANLNKVFIVKLNPDLDTIADFIFMDDTLTKRPLSITVDDEGNYIFCGQTDSSYNEIANPAPDETYTKSYLYKVSPSGETIWKKSYPITNCSSGCWSFFRKVISTYDKGYIAIGTSHVNVHKNIIVKADSLGNQEWVRFYGNPNYENPYLMDIVETADSCIVVCGAYAYDEIGGGLYPYDGWLIKLDKDGNEKWNRKYRDHVLTGMSDWRDTIYSFYMGIYERENGDLITISATHSDENGVYIADKFRLRCLDSGGNIRWDRVIDSVGGQTGILQAQSVKPTADGGIAVAGSAEIFYMDGTQWTSDQRIFLIKTDSLGNDVETMVKPVAAQPISKFELVCYPNPASSEFWVDLPEDDNGDVLEIYATNGSLVYEQPATPGLNRIDLCGVKPGMFLVKLRNANVFGKVVVE